MKKTLRLFSLFLVGIMMLALTACGGPSYPTKETVVYNDSGLKITYIGVDSNGNVFGPQIKFRIENNSGYDLTVQTRKTSVNGYSFGDYDVIMSTDVRNGEKAIATMTFMKSVLEKCGITSLDNVSTSFHVFYTGNFSSHYLDTNIINILKR